MFALKKHSQLSEASLDFHSRVEHLKKVTLFEEICKDVNALEAFAHLMELRKFSPSTSMIREGETGSEMFILVEGYASVFKTTAEGDRYKVAVLDAKHFAFFGEGALLESDARSATINAETQCICLVLHRDRFEEFARTHAHWALPVIQKIARTVLARLTKTNNDLMLLYHALVAEIRGN